MPKLKVQLFLARGTRLYINGRGPKSQSWSSGTTDNDKGYICREYQGLVSPLQDGEWLQFKEFKLDRFEFNIKGAETGWCWEDGRMPPWKKFKTVTLFTDKGKFVLPVTAVKVADPDAEECESAMVGREKHKIDEITLYVEAEGEVAV